MNIDYDSKKIEEQCKNPDKEFRSQPKLANGIKEIMSILKNVDNLGAFRLPVLQKYHLEWLKGYANRMSLRIDKKYRLEFESLSGKQDYIKITAINIKGISNHYD